MLVKWEVKKNAFPEIPHILISKALRGGAETFQKPLAPWETMMINTELSRYWLFVIITKYIDNFLS